jgi:uncharacterized membrane protein YfcA
VLEQLTTCLWLCLTAFLAGVVNSLAGGGTLLTFPALLAVVPPVVANATSTVALVPGSLAGAWGYRRELRQVRQWLLVLSLPSLAGGIVGSELVTTLDEGYFRALVPWLILAATLLFLVQPIVARRPAPSAGGPSVPTVVGVSLFQFFVAVYGGYFGAGIGILMLSALALMGLGDIHRMNALKTFLAVCINGVSVAVFVDKGVVVWPYALAMAAAAIAGGYSGAHYARKMNRELVRWIVVLIGFLLSAYFFYGQWRNAAGS